MNNQSEDSTNSIHSDKNLRLLSTFKRSFDSSNTLNALAAHLVNQPVQPHQTICPHTGPHETHLHIRLQSILLLRSLSHTTCLREPDKHNLLNADDHQIIKQKLQLDNETCNQTHAARGRASISQAPTHTCASSMKSNRGTD